MEKIIDCICIITILLIFVYNLISDDISTTEKLNVLLLMLSGALIECIGYKRGYNDANKNINGDTSRKDPRNEDA